LEERQAVLASTEVRSLARPDVTSICTDIVREIDGALDRMADGSYGYCTLCGRPIPAARLRALPYAAECVACKRQMELETAAAAK
jgi:RNA polymerase-binding transcription factor DksA